jgi:uncharacterized protein YndB with AHSA1/START domain
MTVDRCAARFTRRYDAAPADVWQALTDPDSIARWLAAPPGVEVTRSEPERLLELDWSPPGEPPSLVRIQLHADGACTLLVLDHERIDAALGMRYMRDWGRALGRLEAAL